MLDIWNHYNSRRGEFRSFDLPAEVVSYGSITNYVPGNYLWRYAGPGSVEDLPCGSHNVSLALETVPPIAASVVGADLFLRLRLRAGVANGGEYAPGISGSVSLSVAGGDALVAMNGIRETIEISCEFGDAAGDQYVNGIDYLYMLLMLDVGAAADSGITEPEIGDAYGGGYFAGYISHTADGVATHRLIVAPAATGATGTGYSLATMLTWRTSAQSLFTPGTDSVFDGFANTSAAIAASAANHPAANFCDSLVINGFDDWYLPAIRELEIAYYNLKPATSTNVNNTGANEYAVPPRSTNYTSTVPGQTSVTAFQAGENEAFIGSEHWSSTQNGSNAWIISFTCGNGCDGNGVARSKINFAYRVRAFRREAI
jgi:hypothetical protein